MKFVYLDTEFTGLRQNAELISLALVEEGESFFYIEFDDYKKPVDEWIEQNVVSNLFLIPEAEEAGISWAFQEYYCFGAEKPKYFKDRSKLAETIYFSWLEEDEIQIVGDCPAYDWVLFCEIFGGALNLPANINPNCHDINQDIAQLMGISERQAFNINRDCLVNDELPRLIDNPKAIAGHNSLGDAFLIKKWHQHILSTQKELD